MTKLLRRPAVQRLIGAGIAAYVRFVFATTRWEWRGLELTAAMRSGQGQGIAGPGDRIVDILVGRDDVVIAGQHRRLFQREQVGRVAAQAFHPGELVGIFLAVDRVAVREIDRGHAEFLPTLAIRHIDNSFEITRLFIGICAGQATLRHRERCQ